jgi:hypothetical protein
VKWPIIRCTPGPTDAELAAERDEKHARDVAAFDEEERYLARRGAMDEFTFDHIPPWQVHG